VSGAPQITEKPDELLDLLALSEKYALPYLKFLCEGKISEFLDVDTVVFVLNCARIYRALSLEANCKDFMKSHWDEMQKSASFDDIDAVLKEQIEDILWKRSTYSFARKN